MSRHVVWLILLPVLLGGVAVAWLFIAVTLELPGYDIRCVIPGTGFLSSVLYATPGHTAAYFVVGILYFVYGVILGFLIGFFVTLATDKNGK